MERACKDLIADVSDSEFYILIYVENDHTMHLDYGLKAMPVCYIDIYMEHWRTHKRRHSNLL